MERFTKRKIPGCRHATGYFSGLGRFQGSSKFLVKLPTISLQNPANLLKMNFFTHIFQGFQLDFKLFIVFQNSKSTYFSKQSLISASVSICKNSHTSIFNLSEKCFSFLLFILTSLYNLSHRLTEFNVSLFYLKKLIFFKNI